MDARRRLPAVRDSLLTTAQSRDYTSHAAIWGIAAPMVLSNLSVPLLGLVDTAVVGHLPEPRYLGAVAIGATIFSFLYNGVNFLRMGTTGVAAQALGRKQPEALCRALTEALTVAGAIAILFLLAQVPLRELALGLMAPDPAVRAEAVIYFDIRIWTAPATLATAVMVGWFLGLGNARAPLVIVLVINITNIVLDLVFVLGLKMTTAGVAYASLIAEYAGALVGAKACAKELKTRDIALSFAGITSFQRAKAYFSVNANLFVRTMALMMALFFLTAQSARFGTVVLAANAVLLNLQHVISYALDALAHAAEALGGRAVGANDKVALTTLVRRIFAWSAAIALAIALTFWFGGPALIGLLTDIPLVLETAETYLIWLVLSPIVSVWSFVYDGVFIGATRSRDMRNVMVASAALVYLPAWWLTTSWGNHGLWFAFTLFMFARAVGMHFYYRRRVLPAL